MVLQGEIDVLEVAAEPRQPRSMPRCAPTRSWRSSIPHAANSVHDGALVIQEFRIARAGVICPLSEQNIDLGSAPATAPRSA